MGKGRPGQTAGAGNRSGGPVRHSPLGSTTTGGGSDTMIWRPELEWDATVPAMLHHAVARWGDHDLVVTDVDRLSYRDAEAASRQLAKRLLAAGAGKGSRI